MLHWCRNRFPTLHSFQNNDAVRPSAYQNTCQVLVPKELPLPVLQGISLAPSLSANILVSPPWFPAAVRPVLGLCSVFTDLNWPNPPLISCRKGVKTAYIQAWSELSNQWNYLGFCFTFFSFYIRMWKFRFSFYGDPTVHFFLIYQILCS